MPPKERQTTIASQASRQLATANLRTKILDFRGLDSSRILILRNAILMSMGDFPDILSQEILVGISLVGRLGVAEQLRQPGCCQVAAGAGQGQPGSSLV